MPDHRVLDHLGCRLAYRLRGAGPPALLVQGTGIHGDGWDPQVAALAPRFRCLTFDNRGMGRSQPQAGSLTLARMADDALALLDTCGIDRAHVIGHSLGGAIAIELALRAPARVASLSLLCSFARGRDAAPLTPWMLWTGLRTWLGTRRQRRAAFLRLIRTPQDLVGVNLDALARELEPLFGHDLADQPPVVMAQLAALRAWDATARLGTLAGIPTLVASARYDRIAPPAVGRALAAAIPGSRYHEFPDAAHGVTLRRPDAVNALLLSHLGAAGTETHRATQSTLGARA